MNNSIGFVRRKVDILRRAVRNTDETLSETRVHTAQLQQILDLIGGGTGSVPYPSSRDQKAPKIEVRPVTDIAFPVVDMTAANPVRAILDAPELASVDDFFGQSPAIERSLISVRSQALIYSLIRNLRPDNVFEIGTYRAGTTEAICRGLHGNRHGILHTVDPFSAQVVTGILAQWPRELRRHVRFYAMDSMAFFASKLRSAEDRPALIFVDGNHDYEYAAFDIQSAARVLEPGGFLVVDNIAQPGPFLAARDFLDDNLGWTECGYTDCRLDAAKPFDRERCGIPDTELMILRAPRMAIVGERPIGFPEVVLRGRPVKGVEIALATDASTGTLHVQCIARGFSRDKKTVEAVNVGKVGIDTSGQRKALKVELPVDLNPAEFEQIRAEIWLSWTGAQPVALQRPPTIY